MVPCCWTLIAENRIMPRGFTKRMCESDVPHYTSGFFLNRTKSFLPVLYRLCVVYISALCMHRLTSSTGLLKSWYRLPKTSAGLEYFRPPKACFHHRHCMHVFATVSAVHLSVTLADHPPALWSVRSSSKNQSVAFNCKLEAKFMWVQLPDFEIIWSWSLKNT